MPAFPNLFSEIAVLLASFAMGPLTGILVELIKNLAHLPVSGTMYVGELANFIVGVLFVGTAGWIYQRHKTRSRAYLAMAAGTLAMTVGASLINYFLMIPFYVSAMGFPMETIINLTHKAGNLMVNDLKSLILWVFVPFNLFKGIIVSFIVGLVYKESVHSCIADCHAKPCSGKPPAACWWASACRYWSSVFAIVCFYDPDRNLPDPRLFNMATA